MSTSDNSRADNPMMAQARELLTQLESGNSVDAMQTISSLHFQRDQFLYQEVGKLTRSLHTAIRNFDIDTADDNAAAKDMSKMSDASDRLNYVIEKTENAANKTMDLVEDTIPISSDLGDQARSLKSEWTKLMNKQMKPDEFRALTKQMDSFLDLAAGETSKIDQNLSNILLAQDFQDLTGQVIKRVITLVKDVESNLVELVRMAGTVDHIAGIQHEEEEATIANPEEDAVGAEGPIINAEERDDVVTSQDDVDDLLSSLGF
ncbi:MAG: protein phosphatase CheZ [Pseudomonadales bacterium]|nr:protein phosphatase CheZ [Pseudomonadales bacterium]